MGLQGYVGSGEDVRRIRRQEQQLEEERKKRDTEKQQRDANVSAAGFREFGKGAAEVCKSWWLQVIDLFCVHFAELRLCRRLRQPSASKLLA